MSKAKVEDDSTRWQWQRPAQEDERRSGLSYTDILFGLVLAEIFRRGNELARITGAGRAHLGVALALVAGSWIGYHNSRKRSDYKIQFFNLSLASFVLDMGMVFMYWLLTLNPEGVPELLNRSSHDPSALLEANILLIVFSLYALWDLVAWRMIRCGKYPLIRHDWKRTWVTFGGLILTTLVAIFVWISEPSTTRSVVTIDLILILILIAYRFAKDGLQRQSNTERVE